MQRYSNEFFHINTMHKIKEEYMPNYNDMIGNNPKLNEFNNKPKGGRKILIPLMFWFNKDSGSSLPLVALQYPTITINSKISDLIKIISFEDYEKMYENIIKIIIPYDINNRVKINTNLIYNNYIIDTINKTITYDCLFINNELLKNTYLDLTDSEIQIILVNNGTLYTLNQITKILNPNLTDIQIQIQNSNNGTSVQQYLINKEQWVFFMSNMHDTIIFYNNEFLLQ